MHGLQTLNRINNDAVLSHLGEPQPHLLNAPTADNFTYSIPWSFTKGVATIHIHNDTRTADIIKLKRHINAEFGTSCHIVEKEYN